MYKVTSNLESGHGRSDITLVSLFKEHLDMILRRENEICKFVFKIIPDIYTLSKGIEISSIVLFLS